MLHKSQHDCLRCLILILELVLSGGTGGGVPGVPQGTLSNTWRHCGDYNLGLGLPLASGVEPREAVNDLHTAHRVPTTAVCGDEQGEDLLKASELT